MLECKNCRVKKHPATKNWRSAYEKVFPDKLERSTTFLILKSTKTASSCRTIFMTSALKEELKKWLNQLAADEMKDPTRYHDNGMLFRLPNGLAVEPALIRKKFLKWQDAHPEFPRIVFHGLRHSSATYQLMISDGDGSLHSFKRCRNGSYGRNSNYGIALSIFQCKPIKWYCTDS